jgi:hypothetical protein
MSDNKNIPKIDEKTNIDEKAKIDSVRANLKTSLGVGIQQPQKLVSKDYDDPTGNPGSCHTYGM